MTRSLESLFERYRTRGDVAALAKIFDRTAPELLRIAMHLVREPSVAEDILQETFLAAMESAARFDGSRRLVPWLAGILSNQARRYRRTEARHPDPTRLPIRSEATGGGELEAGVTQGIDALPARYRQIVLLKLGFGMEPAAIAHLLDMPPATVRTRLHRGLEKLRERLPAGLALGLLPPLADLRGIGAIRAIVVGHASATAVTTTAVSTVTLWTLGGVVVTKGKLTGALLLLGLAFAGGVLLQRNWNAEETMPAERPGAVTATTDGGPALRGRDGVRATESLGPKSDVDAVAPESRHVWRLSGHVVDADGKPVPGALVEAWIMRGSAVTPLPGGAADAEGRYSLGLDVIKTWSSVERASATLMARARAPGYRPGDPARFQLVEHADLHAPQGDLLLEPGISLEGRVLDARREPVDKAWVALHRVPRDGTDSYTRTDARGRYAIGTEMPGAYVVAVRSSRGVARLGPQHVAAGRAVTLPDLILSDGTFIGGRVLASDGSSLPGVELFADAIRSADGAQAPSEARKHQLRARTDSDGGFRMFGLWGGRYRIAVSGSLSNVAPIEASMGDHEVVIRAREPALVTRVVGAEGRPLPGAMLSHLGWRSKFAGVVDRIRDGSMTLEAARAVACASSDGDLLAADGTTTMFVEANTRWIVSARIVGAVPAEATVRVAEGEAVTRVDLVIRESVPHGRLDLLVFKPDGTRLKNFSLELCTPLGTGVGTSRPNAHGALLPVEAGPLRVRVLPYGRDSRLARDFGIGGFLLPATAGVEVPPGGRAAATVRLHEGGRFRLRLKYPDGEQPEKDRLRLRIFERANDEAPFQYGSLWVYEGAQGTVATSRFRAAEACLNAKLLAPDDYRLEVRTQKHGTHERTIRIQAGEITDLVIDLRK